MVGLSDGHTHMLMVPAADVAAGAEKTYTTSSVSAHTHTLTVTAAEMVMLAQRQTVTKNSSLADQHVHEITVMCA
jgi:hypothetical protein